MIQLTQDERKLIFALRATIDDNNKICEVLRKYFSLSDDVLTQNHYDVIVDSIHDQWLVNGNSMNEVYLYD